MKRIAIVVLALAMPLQAWALQPKDVLSLVAMPLAVAAVADLAGVPLDPLQSLVASLNQANVPPAEFVQLLRYAPAAIVADTQPQSFVQFVQYQTAQGVTGPALVTVINRQLLNYGLQPAPVPPSQTTVWVEERNYFPPVVRTRVAEASRHPHGGPPGQLKKIEGLQTGAEVVHGARPGRRQLPPPMTSAAPPRHVPPGQAKKMERGPVMVVPPHVMAPQPGSTRGMPPGQQKGGEGHGHGHGKD